MPGWGPRRQDGDPRPPTAEEWSGTGCGALSPRSGPDLSRAEGRCSSGALGEFAQMAQLPVRPHPRRPSRTTLPAPSEAGRRNPTSGPSPGLSLPAWPWVEQRF